jgi:hypothetical protein
MDNNKYQKPTVRTVELQHHSHLLAASAPSPKDYGGTFGYAPELNKDDRNKLA